MRNPGQRFIALFLVMSFLSAQVAMAGEPYMQITFVDEKGRVVSDNNKDPVQPALNLSNDIVRKPIVGGKNDLDGILGRYELVHSDGRIERLGGGDIPLSEVVKSRESLEQITGKNALGDASLGLMKLGGTGTFLCIMSPFFFALGKKMPPEWLKKILIGSVGVLGIGSAGRLLFGESRNLTDISGNITDSKILHPRDFGGEEKLMTVARHLDEAFRTIRKSKNPIVHERQSSKVFNLSAGKRVSAPALVQSASNQAGNSTSAKKAN